MKNLIGQIFQALRGKEFDYTSMSLNRSIILLAVPMVLEMIMESLFAIVDIYYASRLGKEAVATIGLTESVLMIVYSLGFGISMAATAIVARRVGEKKLEKGSFSAAQTITLGLILSFLISIVGLFFSDDILGLMGAEEAVIKSGSNFTRWMLVGNYVIILLFLINGIFRGAGAASKAMYALWISNGLNIVLDPLFMFGWGPIPAFGVTGAAYATNIGRAVGVLFQLYILFNGKSQIKLVIAYLKPNIKEIVKILKVAVGATGQFLIASASWIFLMRIMAEFGSDAVAGYTIAIRVLIFTILPAWGLANAAATLVGQNLGAEQPDKAERSAWRASFINMIFLGTVAIIYFFTAEKIISYFSEEPAIVDYAVKCLRYLCAGYIFFAYGMVLSQAFNGAGDTRTPTVLNLIAFWLVQIPLAYLLAKVYKMGPEGVFYAIIIAETLLAVLGIFAFRRGKWKKQIV
ncbi:MAG: MATE family efflux transporter [Flavobacteriales bacterium]|nr:MATE family efflux transporter [Flavobacteriales bacterium]